jgi:asparagine synthase (glutamine-hydrolysing)
MCGIAGVLYRDRERPVDQTVLTAMGNAIAHRGPDAEGFLIEPGLGLMHRRLSIIDLAGGDQPIANEDGSVQVVFNGEIYNYQHLRTGLRARGHRFRTDSDTEVLVHLYEEHGEDLVDHLRGMFAFALWDRTQRHLLLARDRLGIKPLYVYRDAEKLVFGSELKALLAHPGVARAIDPAAIEDYLTFGMVPGPRSIFKRIEKLPPAHTLLVEPRSLQRSPRRYWQLHLHSDDRLSADEWREAVQSKIAETVRAHLIADVPVGAFLSGGLDSGMIVALSAEHTTGTLRTFSIGFREDAFNELPFARAVATRYATQHAEEVVTADAAALLGALVHYYDEPFADASALPTFLLARLAARSVKVALSGDGGDEAFGGYARYAHDLREAALRRHLPIWLRRMVLRPLAACWPKADWLPRTLRAKTRLTNLSLDGDMAYANTLTVCRQPLRRTLLAPDLASALDGHDPARIVRENYRLASRDDPLGGMITVDVATLLPDRYLVKVDRASMAHGLEVRPPLLDHELLELTARLPSRWKVHRGETKWLFKQICASYLPPSVVERPKQGFDMPVDAWLRGPLRDTFEANVLGSQAPVGDLINQATARRLYRAHCTGVGRFGDALWALLVLATWTQRYLRSAPEPPSPPFGAPTAPLGPTAEIPPVPCP